MLTKQLVRETLLFLLSFVQRLGRWTDDYDVVGLTPGWLTIKWLQRGWVTVCGHVNHLGM